MPKGVYNRAKVEEEKPMAVETPELKDTVAKIEEPEEEGVRVVIHGYGKLAPNKVHFIDDIKFIGGVARDVPADVAECWLKGVRPKETNKPYAVSGKRAYSRVGVIVLPGDATEAQIMKAAGVPAMAVSKFAEFIKAYSTEDLAAALGREKAIELSEGLRKAVGK